MSGRTPEIKAFDFVELDETIMRRVLPHIYEAITSIKSLISNNPLETLDIGGKDKH